MKDVIFVNSHPIQYFAPMYKYMNEQGVTTKAWYSSNESVKGGFDKEFGVDVKWDIPLLEGYEYRFFKNYSWKPSHSSGFFGLINLGMVRELFRIKKSVIIVHGWHYCTHLLILLLGKMRGHTVCLRNDMPQSHELPKKGWQQVIKRIGLRYILFPRVNYFLYIGSQNRLFYKSYDLADPRLVFCPYAVDNCRFKNEFRQLKPVITTIKQNLGIGEEDKVILYSGKYMDKKRPMDLLNAFARLNDQRCWLIMLGEGELRNEMEALISQQQLKQVILTGFINQSNVADYYAIADVLVMCSSYGENWGLSVNEAMNFNLPLILSDLTGCADDLVKDGDNGYIFSTGNVDELTLKLRQILLDNKLTWNTPSELIISNYSYSNVTENISQLIVEA
ncbi:MAG: glycosyltransferase family 4 protein [Ferruginibacter sp.]|nr:glycosyltransferase family 4 protein [Ferruginibacter sp.]